MTARARAAAPAPRTAPAVPRRAPAPRPTPAPRVRRRTRPRLRIGRLWIPLTALLLGGIVWLNVANLQLTNRISQTENAQQTVQADTARLRAAISRRDNSVLVEAKRRLNMDMPAENAVTFLQAPRR